MAKTKANELPARAWAEIDLGALAANYRRLRERAGERRIVAVVKADAYGHGAVGVSRALAAAGCDAFAIATPAEAAELRSAGITAPILLLTGVLNAAEADAALALDLDVVVSRLEELAALGEAARRVGGCARVHLKVDTGMGRLGAAPEAVGDLLRSVSGAGDSLALVGVMTHFAEADDSASPVTAHQRAGFAAALAGIRAAGFDPEWIHADNSAAILTGPTPETTAVRAGLALYGAEPLRDGDSGLAPVMHLFARVLHTKTVPAGARIGYGGTWVAKAPTSILTLGLGYADGLPRAAGGAFSVWAGGQRAPIVGVVSCDLTTVAGSAAVDDVALIFGTGEGGGVRVEELAHAVGTIPYEILVRIGARVPRRVRG